MEENAVAAVRAELGADPPEGFVATLSSEELASFAATVRDAKRRQAEELRRAGEEALGHLPGLVRKAVERALR